MANVLITNQCNRKCSFCFAKTRLGQARNEAATQYMSRENFLRVLDLLERSDVFQLRLLGGEPTLHPGVIEFVQEAVGRDFHVHIFTNAMMPPAVADYLATLTPKQVSLLCNVSPQANDSREMISRRHYALERLGERAGVGITVTSSEFEWDFLLQYVREYKLRKRIRIGIAQPIVGEHNDYITPEAYGGLGAQIVRMAQACVKEDVLIGFDCGMTLCMFTPEQIGALSVSSDGYTCACKPVIDIGPDLDVWHCFPLAEVLNVHLNHFQYRGQIQRYYERLVRPYKSLGCKPECVRCDFLRRGQCTGGCLAHAMNALNRPPPQFAPRPSSPLRVSP